jgi:DNA-binding CsgD family transcriptional regulator
MIGGVARRVSSPVLVGRAAEVARLNAALERAAAGRPAIVVVAGEAGVGKTRLVAGLLGRAGERGAVALTGGCLDVGEGVLAYAPMVEALRPLVGVLDAGELERVLGRARGELARLVPELGPPDGGRPAEAPLAPTRLFELLLGVLHRLAERGPVLLVVEDLHWADQSIRDLLGFLVRNLRAGVALVLTYRSDELHRRHPLRPFLAELDRSGRAERLELGRLGRRELAELLSGILDEPVAPALAGDIWPARRATRSSPRSCWRPTYDLLPVQRGPLHAAYARALEGRIEQRGDVSGAGRAGCTPTSPPSWTWPAVPPRPSRSTSPVLTWSARWREAEALLAQGAPRPAAGAALAKARTLASGLGARLLTAEIDSLGRRSRIELAVPAGGEPDGPAGEPAAATDDLGLTPREREVLALVADGRTNRQIAQALFISSKTASVHVSNILAKLGVANRGEAAAVAHRLRLTG